MSNELAGRLVQAAVEMIPVDPDDGTVPLGWEQHSLDDPYESPVWGPPEPIAKAVVVAVLRRLEEYYTLYQPDERFDYDRIAELVEELES